VSTPSWVHLPTGPISYIDVGTGPVVVLVHGVLMDHTVWRSVVPRLAEHARVITPTLPLGAHPRPMAEGADLSMRGQVHLLADFLDALDLCDVTLVVNDWGGPLFLTAEGRDQRVGRLVVTPCEAFDNFPPGLPGRTATVASATDLGLYLGLRMLRIGWVRRIPLMLGWMAKRPLTADLINSWTAPGLGDPRIRSDLRRYSSGSWSKADCIAATEALEHFGRPALVIWAPENKVMPREHGERLANLLDAPLVEVDDAYVLLSEDQPVLLADHVLSAITAHP
jgi:pimeloyl-ACP methyl ester carboxylesterase